MYSSTSYEASSHYSDQYIWSTESIEDSPVPLWAKVSQPSQPHKRPVPEEITRSHHSQDESIEDSPVPLWAAVSQPVHEETTRSRQLQYLSQQNRLATTYAIRPITITTVESPTQTSPESPPLICRTPPPGSPVDLEALASYNAAIAHNKVYCEKAAQAEQHAQASPEGKHKRSLMANLCAQFIIQRFPDHDAKGRDGVGLYNAIYYALDRVLCNGVVAHGALIILDRVYAIEQDRSAQSHRRRFLDLSHYDLFIAAYMLAHKSILDDYYGMVSWVAVCGDMYRPKKIAKIEWEMVKFLDWNVAVTGDQLRASMKRFGDGQ